MEQNFSLEANDGIVDCGKQRIDHHRTHTGERPYACSVCNKRFTQKSHLMIHKRTHTGEKPYACGICHKRFAQSSHLKNHKRIHTGEKAYLCSYCKMGFSKKTRLEQHLQEHILRQALVTKNKKIVLEKEPNKVLSTLKNITKEAHEVKGDASRKRKTSVVARLHQTESDMELSLLANNGDPGGDTGLNDIVNKAEPLEDHQIFSSCDDGSNFQRHTGLSSGTLERDASVEEDARQQGNSFLPDWDSTENVTTFGKSSANTSQQIANQVFAGADMPEDQPNPCLVTSSVQKPSNRFLDEGSAATMNSNCYKSFQAVSPEQTSRDSNLNSVLNSRKKFRPPSHTTRNKNETKSSISQRYSSGNGRDSRQSYHTNKSITLIDFSAEDLISHLMARDKVLRCDYCCIIFQDPAMYHLHHSMHDKSDIRCCNACGKMSRDKYDFVAHYLSEHK